MQHNYTPLCTVADRASRMALSDIFKAIDDVNEAQHEVANTYGKARTEAETVSLFQFAKQSIISSRVFIEETLVDEVVLNDIMRNLINLYSGMVITAVGLNTVVRGTTTAKDVLGIVGTEDYPAPILDHNALVDQYILGARATHLSAHSKAKLQVTNPSPSTNTSSTDDGTTTNGVQHKDEVSHTNSIHAGVSANTVKLETREGNLPCARLLQLDIDTGAMQSNKNEDSDDKKFKSTSVAVNVLVQLRPKFVPSEVARAFVDLNFVPPKELRYLQMQTGEISFFKDFLFCQDIRNRRRKALLADKSGVLSDMLDAQANSLKRHFDKMATSGLKLTRFDGMFNGNNSANIANTILVFDKRSFDQACSASGVNFDNDKVRSEFFSKTYAMILVIVDTSFGRVDMYYNGISDKSSFTFRQLATNARAETTDLVTIMKNYASNTAPRF